LCSVVEKKKMMTKSGMKIVQIYLTYYFVTSPECGRVKGPSPMLYILSKGNDQKIKLWKHIH